MESHELSGRFGLRLTPMPVGNASVLFAALFIMSAILWANVPFGGFNDAGRYWGVIVLAGLPVLLISFRLLFNLFADARFAVSLIAALVVISAAATSLLPVDEALAKVFRTFPFAALGVSLSASLVACTLKRRWNRAALPFITLHAGLLVAIAGGFVSLFARTEGTAVLSPGRSVSEMLTTRFVLEVRGPGGQETGVPLPAPPKGQVRFETAAGDLKLRVVTSGGTSAPRQVMVIAEKGGESVAAILHEVGQSESITLGDDAYIFSLFRAPLALPFSMTLESARVEYYPGGTVPKAFRADIVISEDGAAGEAAVVRVNAPAAAGGYSVYVNSFERGGFVVFEIVRDPGANILFAGGVLFVAGLTWTFARKVAPKGKDTKAG